MLPTTPIFLPPRSNQVNCDRMNGGLRCKATGRAPATPHSAARKPHTARLTIGIRFISAAFARGQAYIGEWPLLADSARQPNPQNAPTACATKPRKLDITCGRARASARDEQPII